MSYVGSRKRIENDLLSKSLAFFKRGKEGALKASDSAADPRDLVFALVDLATSIELMLKARLAREHWTLFVVDVSKVKFQQFREGKVQTVGYKESIDRLKNITDLDFAEDKRHQTFYPGISKVFQFRNRVVHFTVDMSEPALIQQQLVNALGFAIAFLESQWENRTFNELEDVPQLLETLEELGTRRMDSLRPEIDRALITFKCPYCYKNALVIEAEEVPPKCLFCLQDRYIDPPTMALEYKSVILNETNFSEGELQAEECPGCGAYALIGGVKPIKKRISTDCHFICFECGSYYDRRSLDWCIHCGSPALGADLPVCQPCFQYELSRQD